MRTISSLSTMLVLALLAMAAQVRADTDAAWAWGHSCAGEFGDGSNGSWAVSPQQVPGLQRTRSVGAGLFHCFAAQGANACPTAIDQTVNAAPRAGQNISLTSTDHDSGGLTHPFMLGPSNRTPIGMPPNVTYPCTGDFGGADTFEFTVDDGRATSTPATVSQPASKANKVDRSDVGPSRVLLRGYPYRKADNSGIVARPLAASIAGTDVGGAATGTVGVSALTWVIDRGAATSTLGVATAGSAAFEPSSPATVLTVATHDTALLPPADRATWLSQ